VRILSFTGGAGAMYCGSCLRDNALAAALLARGHDVVLSPVYTPTRTDERNVSDPHVFFGGISVFLEQHSPVFRHTPRALDRLWDSAWALRMASKRQIKVNPQSLGELTVSMLKGEQGFQTKEIAKLLDWLRLEPRFEIIVIPYSLLLGVAGPLKRELKVPIGCTLQGDDLFLDGLGEPYRQQAMTLIRDASRHVDGFFPVSEYYRDFMPSYLGVSREKMHVIPLGINVEGYALREEKRSDTFTVGYLARIAPEKGLHVLCEAYTKLRAQAGAGKARLVAAGYLPPEHHGYLDAARATLRAAGCEGEFEYRGEVDRTEKIRFLQGLDVLSVPTVYTEPKGMFVLEAMAAGVPVVQPRKGAFPEILAKTGGGLIVDPDPDALAAGILSLWRDPDRALALGRTGAAGVREHYEVSRMAETAEVAYRHVAKAAARATI
jgi:glycosyltransferase involved in cell wall biosynthesis